MMVFSVILIEDSENYRNILKNVMQRLMVPVVGCYSHSEFPISRLAVVPDIALLSFGRSLSVTSETVAILRKDYGLTKLAMLISKYDIVSQEELNKLELDALMYKAADDPSEIMKMLQTLADGKKYFQSDKFDPGKLH